MMRGAPKAMRLHIGLFGRMALVCWDSAIFHSL